MPAHLAKLDDRSPDTLGRARTISLQGVEFEASFDEQLEEPGIGSRLFGRFCRAECLASGLQRGDECRMVLGRRVRL